MRLGRHRLAHPRRQVAGEQLGGDGVAQGPAQRRVQGHGVALDVVAEPGGGGHAGPGQAVEKLGQGGGMVRVEQAGDPLVQAHDHGGLPAGRARAGGHGHARLGGRFWGRRRVRRVGELHGGAGQDLGQGVGHGLAHGVVGDGVLLGRPLPRPVRPHAGHPASPNRPYEGVLTSRPSASAARSTSSRRLDHDVGAGGDQQLGVVEPGDPDGGHGPRLGRLDAGRGVLQHDRLRRRHAELGGRGEEHLRMGLAVLEVAPGDIGVEDVEQRAPRAAPSTRRSRAPRRRCRGGWCAGTGRRSSTTRPPPPPGRRP